MKLRNDSSEESYGTTAAIMLELNLYDVVEVRAMESSGDANTVMMNSFEGRLLP